MNDFLRQLMEIMNKLGEQPSSDELAAHKQVAQEQMGPPAPVGPRDALGVPGMIQKGNIDLAHRPLVYNQDGSYSTVRSMGALVNGKETLVPTVHPQGYIMGNNEAIQHANQTNENLGVFKDAASSERYAQNLHEDQAGTYDQMAQRGDPTVGPPRPPMASFQVGRPQMQPQLTVGTPEMEGQPQQPPMEVPGLKISRDAETGGPMLPPIVIKINRDGSKSAEISHEVLTQLMKAPRKRKSE